MSVCACTSFRSRKSLSAVLCLSALRCSAALKEPTCLMHICFATGLRTDFQKSNTKDECLLCPYGVEIVGRDADAFPRGLVAAMRVASMLSLPLAFFSMRPAKRTCMCDSAGLYIKAPAMRRLVPHLLANLQFQTQLNKELCLLRLCPLFLYLRTQQC